MNTDTLKDLLQIILPAGLVLYAMYLTVKSFLDKELEKRVLDLRSKNTELVLPVRLQAYERMCLFLERIAPNNLLVRLSNSTYSAREFHQVLLGDIREEYNHNLSQQVYLSDQAWVAIRSAMEEVVIIINTSAGTLSPDASSLDLVRAVFDNLINRPYDPTSQALKVIKDEIRQSF